MRKRPFALARAGLAVLMTLAMLVSPAIADDDTENQPFHEPGIMYRDHSKPYIPILFACLIAGAVLLVAFKNPHRSHLD